MIKSVKIFNHGKRILPISCVSTDEGDNYYYKNGITVKILKTGKISIKELPRQKVVL